MLPENTEVDGDAARDILQWVNGKRSIGDVIDASGYPKFMVLRTLYELVIRGAIRIQGVGEPLFADAWNPARIAD